MRGKNRSREKVKRKEEDHKWRARSKRNREKRTISRRERTKRETDALLGLRRRIHKRTSHLSALLNPSHPRKEQQKKQKQEAETLHRAVGKRGMQKKKGVRGTERRTEEDTLVTVFGNIGSSTFLGPPELLQPENEKRKEAEERGGVTSLIQNNKEERKEKKQQLQKQNAEKE